MDFVLLFLSKLVGFCLNILLIVFIVLKLTGGIDWSWWLVFMPLIVPLGIVLLVLLAHERSMSNMVDLIGDITQRLT